MGTVKIVRDRLAARIPAVALRHAYDNEEAQALLAAKIAEERDEIVASNFSDPAEYADCLEALQALARQSGVSWIDVLVAQASKRARLGSFNDRLVYDRSLDPDHA